ncbi:MAG: hypothetical protein ACREEC_00225, partial [Thermoplasmata archaeon]
MKRSDLRHRLLLLSFAVLFLPLGLLGLSAAAPAPHAAPVAAPSIHPFATHGDLIVGPTDSPYVLSPTTTGSTTYYEQGNITVLPGGALYVDYLTLYFVQFIATNGTVGQRAAHLYNFTDQGLVVFANAALTTDVGVLNPYTMLNLEISGGGTFSATASKLQFPGTVSVDGTGSALYLNDSVVSKNPLIPYLSEYVTLRADTSFSPALLVENGARASILASQWNDYFGENFLTSGQPLTNLTDLQSVALSSGQGQTFTSYTLGSPVAPYLALALGNQRIAQAELALQFVAPANLTVAAGSAVNFDGAWTLGGFSLNMPTPNTVTTEEIALPASFLHEVGTQGLISLLQATGQFGTPSALSFHLGNVSASVTILQSQIVLVPDYGWNMTVQGGSTLTVADSQLDLNWNATYGTPVSPGVPLPTQWGSQKLVLSGNSLAFLANVSVPTAFTTTFDNASMTL